MEGKIPKGSKHDKGNKKNYRTPLNLPKGKSKLIN